MENEKRMWDAYHVREYSEGKSQWTRIGIAFLNRDQSINVVLDALPITGKVQLRLKDSQKKYKQKGETV